MTSKFSVAYFCGEMLFNSVTVAKVKLHWYIYVCVCVCVRARRCVLLSLFLYYLC